MLLLIIIITWGYWEEEEEEEGEGEEEENEEETILIGHRVTATAMCFAHCIISDQFIYDCFCVFPTFNLIFILKTDMGDDHFGGDIHKLPICCCGTHGWRDVRFSNGVAFTSALFLSRPHCMIQYIHLIIYIVKETDEFGHWRRHYCFLKIYVV